MSAPGSSTRPLVFEDPTAVEMHVVIEGIEQPIWRRLVVPLDFTRAQLHTILQAAFGWTDSHLHRASASCADRANRRHEIPV